MKHHSKVLPTTSYLIPQGTSSGKPMQWVHEQDDLHVNIVRIDRWLFHCAYILEDEHVHLWRVRVLESQLSRASERIEIPLIVRSFVHLEIRMKQNKKNTPKDQHQHLTTNTSRKHPTLVPLQQ